MMTERQLIERFLELQEHPEQLTDEQLQQILADEQMGQLVEQLGFAKRAFKSKESGVGSDEFLVDDEWRRFAARHWPSRGYYKLAASFVGVLLMSGIAFAAIVRIARPAQEPQAPQECVATAAVQPSAPGPRPAPADTLAAEPRVFNNVPLDSMLSEMAAAYRVGLEFQNEEARQLRFHFVWKRDDSLGRVVEKLNTFERVNLIVSDEKLIVR